MSKTTNTKLPARPLCFPDSPLAVHILCLKALQKGEEPPVELSEDERFGVLNNFMLLIVAPDGTVCRVHNDSPEGTLYEIDMSIGWLFDRVGHPAPYPAVCHQHRLQLHRKIDVDQCAGRLIELGLVGAGEKDVMDLELWFRVRHQAKTHIESLSVEEKPDEWECRWHFDEMIRVLTANSTLPDHLQRAVLTGEVILNDCGNWGGDWPRMDPFLYLINSPRDHGLFRSSLGGWRWEFDSRNRLRDTANSDDWAGNPEWLEFPDAPEPVQ